MKRSILVGLLADTWEQRNADRHVLTLSMEQDVQIFTDFTRKTKVRSLHKIQSPEAIKNGFGEFQDEYNPTFEKLTMSAVVITPEGKRIHHNKVQDKARSGNNAVYDDTRVVTLTVPNLTVGSTVELRIAYHNFKPRVPGQIELFHQIEPSGEAKRVRYAVTWPQGMDLTFLPVNGLAPGKSTVTNGKHTLEWAFNDRDEIPDEDHMPPWNTWQGPWPFPTGRIGPNWTPSLPRWSRDRPKSRPPSKSWRRKSWPNPPPPPTVFKRSLTTSTTTSATSP
ncbi:MAG: DUF3857 domain-containing protein [Elusimicrobia bacterium]|nr:DUF3857 domain-containing protein [Elusimicrobiota bacterium]